MCCADVCRVLVLDQGMLVESGEPHVLLQHDSGIFSGMVAQTGPSSSTHLKEVARVASVTREASRTALQLHQRDIPLVQLDMLQQQLRLQSEVLVRRYVDNPVVDQDDVQLQVQGQQDLAGNLDTPYARMDSAISRYGLQVICDSQLMLAQCAGQCIKSTMAPAPAVPPAPAPAPVSLFWMHCIIV